MEYTKEIIKNRPSIEGVIVGTFLSDLTLFSEFSLTEKDFIIDKCKYFFEIGKEISSRYSEINEVVVSTFLSENKDLQEKFQNFGGWESMEKAKSIADIANIETHIDELEKNSLLIRLDNKGFNVVNDIEFDGITINPLEEFSKMSSYEVQEFYEMLISDCGINSIGNDIEIEELIITDEDLEDFKNQQDLGIPYSVAMRWENEEGEERHINACPILNSLTTGIHKGEIYHVAGHSGTGKSTWSFNSLVLAAVESGEKAVIFSNEQNSKYFKNMLLTYVCNTVFKCKTITRRKITSWTVNEEELEVIKKAQKFIKEKYSGKLKFIKMLDFNVETMIKVSKKLIINEGFGLVMIDTFKSENASDTNAVGEMVTASREFHKMAMKYNVAVILTQQLTSGNEGRVSYLTASDLANSKQVKEVAGVLVLMRKVANDIELDGSNMKYYLNPYKREKVNGKWETVSLTLDKDKNYRLVFLNKNRFGEDNKVIIYEMEADFGGKFKEVGFAGYVSRQPLSF